ncbi:MAG: glycosyltransferase family 2 protein [Cytophagaceae bacterium]|jgi:GT2 family glycosyltransferase|nr:glycosyltransferase family 2 protein [Cytophagaceae bacterium]
MKKLSIVLLTWNSERHASHCLESIMAIDRNKEIIIVDNGSTDGTLAILEQYATRPHIHIVKNSVNRGVSAGRNTGLKMATGDAILLLDIDTVVNAEAIDALINYIEQHPDCGICACKLINRAGFVQNSCRKYPRLSYKFRNVLSSVLEKHNCFRKWKAAIDHNNQSQFYHSKMLGKSPFEVEYVIGACQLMPASVIKKVGLLDENIFYGPEDADFCLRVHQSGLKVVYLPYVSIMHDYQQITNRRIFSPMSRIHIKALLYFFRKHRGRKVKNKE